MKTMQVTVPRRAKRKQKTTPEQRQQYKAVMQAIATAKANAVVPGETMPNRKTILQQAGVCSSYFWKDNTCAQKALAAYEAAAAIVGKAPRGPRSFKSQQQLAEPIATQIAPPQPSKQDQLLAQLKHQEIHLSRLPNLLGVTPEKAKAIAQQLLDEGLVEIKRYPEKVDKKGEFDRLVLKQQEGEKAA